MGRFRHRDLASIVFSVIVFSVIVFNEHLSGGDSINMTVVCIIAHSVIGHGFSSNPLVAALVKQIKGS